MANKFKHIAGLNLLLQGFISLQKDSDKEFKGASEKAQDLFYNKMRENISLTCHTLKDLKLLGHPYSKKHPISIHTPTWLVHTQTGALLDAVEKVSEDLPDKTKVRDVGIDETKAPWAKNVIFGTDKMVARDFITGTFEQVEKEGLEFFAKAVSNIVTHGT